MLFQKSLAGSCWLDGSLPICMQIQAWLRYKADLRSNQMLASYCSAGARDHALCKCLHQGISMVGVSQKKSP